MADRSKDHEKKREFDDIFQYLNSFGTYQKIVFFAIHLMIFPVAMQFDALVFGFSTPHFHCVTPNVTCADKKCCSDCKEYTFDGPFHSTVSEVSVFVSQTYMSSEKRLSC